MTARLSPTPVQKFWDAQGNPLAFGFLYTYAAGTTTPQATYVDSTQTTPNTNPIVLNSRGECNLWLNPTLGYKYVLTDSAGNQINVTDNIRGPLGVDQDVIPAQNNVYSLGSASYAWKQLYLGPNGATAFDSVTGNIGYYARTPAEIAALVTPVNYAYAPYNALRYGADPTGVADSTTALQNLIKVCESDTAGDAQEAYIPGGVYKRAATINFTKRYIKLRGAGKDVTNITSSGVSGNIFSLTAPVSGYWEPTISDFSVNADSSSGNCFDISALTGNDEMFDFDFHNLRTQQGGAAFYGTNVFSGIFRNFISYSYNSHSFMVSCGPGVLWLSCYAENCAAGKAGFRLLGNINLIECNGLNGGDFWGVFGQDTTANDGFQNDFPGLTDYPGVDLNGCNIEAFAQSTTTAYGILLHNSWKRLNIQGGSVSRQVASVFGGIIRARVGAFVSNSIAQIGWSVMFLNAQAAKGPTGALSSGGEFYCDSQMFFEDSCETLANHGYTSYYSGNYAAQVPILTNAASNDVYNDNGYAVNAISPRRLSLQMERFAEPAALTPVGANQAIDVTGYTKVIVSPAAAASISSATFTQTIGAGLDYKRNGRLIIEAGNGNLTINHSAAGAYTFFLTGGANLALGAGKLVQFLFSETNGNWYQV
jgi:Pectate lyase superfamily protein